MKNNQTIPKRADVDPAYTWSVEDLFAREEDWEQAFQEVKDYPEIIKRFQGRLGESAETLLQYLKTSEEYGRKILRLAGYANLRCDEDTANTEAQSRKGRFYSWMAQAESETAFEEPELLTIPRETLDSMMEQEPELAGYRRFFEKKLRRKEHVLSEAEEALLAGASELGDAPEDIYGSFLYADMKFPSVVDVEGKIHELTNGSYISLVQSQDAYLRKNAFSHYYQVYENYKNTLASMLNAQVKKEIFFARARKYPSAMEAALDRTEVPVSVYRNLISAVHSNMEPMYRYMNLRKKLLGVDTLHMYDIYVPLVPDSKKEIDFETAKREVVEATKILGEEYSRVLESGFQDRWVDVYENQGKRSGAYSSFTQEHPFVLLNYKDNLDSEFTLAHEMGHSMHSYFSHKYQPQAYSSYVIFVAEVASTCNEALLMQYLLKKNSDPAQRAILLNYFLEQFRSTVYRQTMFAEFEKDIYEKAEQGEVLTADALTKKYMDLNRLYYGQDVFLDEEIGMEWSRIPHFYYDFYVYQYSTGFAAAIALSQRILREGQPAVEDYLNFLKGGCSQDPISLLKMAGVDMTTNEPINQALEYFGELVDEFEELMKQSGRIK
ncbi:MAG: oligoendopeptidase F [Clostridiales bacterium]|nr:oligoendopeptidase F [Clostridiales bacterium]